jgi:hypothetical protein
VDPHQPQFGCGLGWVQSSYSSQQPSYSFFLVFTFLSHDLFFLGFVNVRAVINPVILATVEAL